MKPIKKIFSLLVFLLVGVLGFVDAQPYIIAVEDNAAPWSNKDGTGYANDIVKAAYKELGIDIELLVVPYSRAKEMILKGKVVAAFSMSWAPELNSKVIFPHTPLLENYSDYFIRSTDVKKKFLPGGKVGVVSGYEYPPELDALRKKHVLTTEESESEISNLKKLVIGRLDMVLLNTNSTKPPELLIQEAGVSGKVRKLSRCGSQKAYIGFSVLHRDGKKALSEFEKGMQLISKNGKLAHIELKWQGLSNAGLAKPNK